MSSLGLPQLLMATSAVAINTKSVWVCASPPVLSYLRRSSVITNCSQLQYCVLFLFGSGLNSLQTPLKYSSLYLKPEPRIWGRTMENETKREAYGNYQPGP